MLAAPRLRFGRSDGLLQRENIDTAVVLGLRAKVVF